MRHAPLPGARARTPIPIGRRHWTGSAGCPGVQEFPAAPDGYARLLAWLRGFGAVHLAGIEGTGSYGAGLARHSCGRDGQAGAIRALMVAKRTARAQRTQTICQARALIITGPDGIRARFTGQTPAGLAAEPAALRPRPGSMAGCHTLPALRELGRRAQFPGARPERLDDLIVPLVRPLEAARRGGTDRTRRDRTRAAPVLPPPTGGRRGAPASSRGRE
jgi:hypothetical protein